MNYIFCDIDGPLFPGKMRLFLDNRKINPNELDKAKPWFDPIAVRIFNLWAKYSDARIIFSTNWATRPNVNEDYLKSVMLDNGLNFNYHENVLTPKKFTSERGHEIWWWLIDNAKDGDKFIAVDDDTSCKYIADYLQPRAQDKHYPNGKPNITGKWIEVDYSNGLTMENFEEGCKALNIDIDKMNEEEFGIKPMSEEEKKKHQEALDMLIHCAI